MVGDTPRDGGESTSERFGGGKESAVGGIGEWPTGRLLSTAARMVEHAWVEELEKRGLTHAGLIALHLLTESARSQTELARLARVENQTMSRTLDRLQRDGFVTRASDPADRRRHIVEITAAGRAVWEETRSIENTLVADASGVADAASAAAFRLALMHIIASSSERRWNSPPPYPIPPTTAS